MQNVPRYHGSLPVQSTGMVAGCTAHLGTPRQTMRHPGSHGGHARTAPGNPLGQTGPVPPGRQVRNSYFTHILWLMYGSIRYEKYLFINIIFF